MVQANRELVVTATVGKDTTVNLKQLSGRGPGSQFLPEVCRLGRRQTRQDCFLLWRRLKIEGSVSTETALDSRRRRPSKAVKMKVPLARSGPPTVPPYR